MPDPVYDLRPIGLEQLDAATDIVDTDLLFVQDADGNPFNVTGETLAASTALSSRYAALERWTFPETYGAVGDGVELTDLAITGNVVTSATATFTNADIGKSILITGAGQSAAGTTNGIPYAAEVAPLYTTISSVTDAHTVVTVASANQNVTGAYGVYGTDNADAMRSTFLSSSTTGRAIWISAKNYCTGKPLDFLNRTTVFCAGQLILMNDPTVAGGFLICKAADDNITWFGGIINCGELTNMNGIAVGYDPTGNVFSRNITFRPSLVTRARINPAAHAAYPFSGGGKGVTAQFHLEGFTFDGRIENCDIGGTIESAQTNNQLTSNVRIIATIKDCPYAAMVFGGSLPSGVASLDSWGSTESQYSQSRVDVIVENCGTVAAVGTTKAQFWSNWMTNLEMNAFVRNANATGTTLWKGNVAHSVIKIRAALDYMVDGFDVSAYTGASNSGLSSSGSVLEMDFDLKNTISGTLFRGGGLESRLSMIASYDASPSPSSLVSGISGSNSNRHRFYSKRFGFERLGTTLDTTSNANGDPLRFALSYVIFGKIARWAQSATVPTSVTLVDGDVSAADGTVQSAGWGFAGPGPYLYRIAQLAWGKIRSLAPPIDLAATATLVTNQSDTLITNNAASGLVVFTLPAPVANTRGTIWRFAVVNANGIRIQAPTGTTITIPGVGTSSSGGTATCTTVGGTLELTQATSTAWYATGGMASGWAVA